MWNVNCKSDKFYFVKLRINKDGTQQGPKVSWKEQNGISATALAVCANDIRGT